jgi:hypothetical protein
MLNEKNIHRLKEQLIGLGVRPEIEYDLRINICLQPDYFHITHRQLKDVDTMNSVFYFEKKEDEYHCLYYESCLRKNIVITEMEDLQERMTAINWNTLFINEVKRTLVEEEIIDGIITDLKKLSATSEGYHLAERLKIKFWIGTPLESYIPNVNTLRNQYEISQRFYFFEGETRINLDEAYRFLCHRWREKQLNARKKQTDNSGSETSADSGPKLLLKKKGKVKKLKPGR